MTSGVPANVETSVMELIFEIGFNHCCRNWSSKESVSEDVSLRVSCNYFNQITSVTESCIIEFFGDWAKTLSFLQPGMDVKLVVLPPVSSTSRMTDAFTKYVIVKNLTCPEPMEIRYLIKRVFVAEVVDKGPYRTLSFDEHGRILECRTDPPGSKALPVPNHWLMHKRQFPEKSYDMYRPLTSVSCDVPVINAVVAFISNSAPGPYEFIGGNNVHYVRTHAQVCDYGYRNLSLSSIRSNDSDLSRDIPFYHLHIQIDKDMAIPSSLHGNLSLTSLPWLTVGDVLVVHTVKPWFVQKQVWNLLHKEKKFGQTKIDIYRIEDGVEDGTLEGAFEGTPDGMFKMPIPVDVFGQQRGSGDIPAFPSESVALFKWMKARLRKDSLLGRFNGEAQLNQRHNWTNGRDIVVQVNSTNEFSSSLFVTDFSVEADVEVRIRTTQQRVNDTMKYFFGHVEKCLSGGGFKNPQDEPNPSPPLYVLLRNVRSSETACICCVEHVTRVPAFCFDVQRLLNRKLEGAAVKCEENPSDIQLGTNGINTLVDEGLCARSTLPQKRLSASNSPRGCVEAFSQIEFEFVDENTQNIIPRESQIGQDGQKRLKSFN